MTSVVLYLVLAFHVLFTDGVKFRCDYIYTDDGWFKYHEMPLTWNDAYLQCKLEGGMLASPTIAGIKSIMTELTYRSSDIFTGIRSTHSKGQYYSIDGIPLAEIPHEWAQGEPDNNNNVEDCLAFNSEGRFSDVKCDVPRPFICHRKPSNVDVTVCGTPDTEYRYDNRTNKCYKFHAKPTTFASAYFTCSAEGGHLAIINSDEELKVIHDLHALYPPGKIEGHYDKNSAFLGFYYKEDIDDWTTIHGQSLEDAGFTRFSEGQPSNRGTGEDCGAIYRDSYFNDVSCVTRFSFICEKKPDYPAVCDSISRNTSPCSRPCNVVQEQGNKPKGVWFNFDRFTRN